ncbi:MAG: alpha/beta hydrolase family protein, partial [Aridibacter sp.]
NFDPTKKYPVMSHVYGGPHLPQVKNAWGGSKYMWHQLLAQKGYIVWILDPRSASGKGEKETWTAYKKLGQTEFLDLEDGVKFLKSQPYVDGDRIGIWGWSYGGFMTSYALTHGKSFKIGIAGGTVSDWALYDSIYTERYMLTPENNPTGYAKTSVLGNAKDLSGKLLLIHGAIDNNVHIQNTIKFVYELQKAGKQFDLMIYPTQQHGISDPQQVYHLYSMMTDFITENL